MSSKLYLFKGIVLSLNYFNDHSQTSRTPYRRLSPQYRHPLLPLIMDTALGLTETKIHINSTSEIRTPPYHGQFDYSD